MRLTAFDATRIAKVNRVQTSMTEFTHPCGCQVRRQCRSILLKELHQQRNLLFPKLTRPQPDRSQRVNLCSIHSHKIGKGRGAEDRQRSLRCIECMEQRTGDIFLRTQHAQSTPRPVPDFRRLAPKNVGVVATSVPFTTVK